MSRDAGRHHRGSRRRERLGASGTRDDALERSFGDAANRAPCASRCFQAVDGREHSLDTERAVSEIAMDQKSGLERATATHGGEYSSEVVKTRYTADYGVSQHHRSAVVRVTHSGAILSRRV